MLMLRFSLSPSFFLLFLLLQLTNYRINNRRLFASVYFERVVKATDSGLSIWARNVQLAFYSCFFFIGMRCYESATGSAAVGHGWDLMVLFLSFLGAFGGILIALTIKYAGDSGSLSAWLLLAQRPFRLHPPPPLPHTHTHTSTHTYTHTYTSTQVHKYTHTHAFIHCCGRRTCQNHGSHWIDRSARVYRLHNIERAAVKL